MVSSRLFARHGRDGMDPKDAFSSHAFDPATLRILYAAFDTVWDRVAQFTDASSCDRVREAIAVALIDMASAGQRDPDRLASYALDRARAALT
jgi:hypothetical protein